MECGRYRSDRQRRPGTFLDPVQASRALEFARGSRCNLRIDWKSVPLLPQARALAQAGCVTGASGRNWSGYGEQVRLPPSWDAADQALLTDPQTSGGLLVSCSASAVDAVLEVFRRHGFAAAAACGAVEESALLPALTVRR